MQVSPKDIAVVIPAYNEDIKLQKVISRIPADFVNEIIIVDDGSTYPYELEPCSIKLTVLRHKKRNGVGAALRTGYKYAIDEKYKFVITLAGNNKDAPEDIPRILELTDKFDLIQGSRYIGPKSEFGPMPLYRKFSTRYLHPKICTIRMKMKMTDTTNGFRVIRINILKDKRLFLSSNLFNKYAFEVALLLLAPKLGYRVSEFQTQKVYPTKILGQTKMKPITGWWSILWPTLTPFFLLKWMAS
jgi:dolichol-phosphate mannosyltransferase